MIAAKHIKHIPGLGHVVDLIEMDGDKTKVVRMSPVDAQHALAVDPKRWSLEKPAIEDHTEESKA